MDILKVARLARIELSEAEAETFGKQLASVIGHIHQLEKVNTEGVEPLITPVEGPSFWREDVSHGELEIEEVFSQAPDRQGHLFKVPPVI